MTKDEMPVKSQGALSISGVGQLARTTFIDLAKNNDMTQGQLFTLMFDNYLNLYVEFSEADNTIIRQAQKIAPDTLKRKIKKSVVRYADEIINPKDVPNEAAARVGLKSSPRAADVRADMLLKQIFKDNDNAINWYDKILLTKSSLLNYIEKQKTLEPEIISIGKTVLDRCLERNKELIKEHHEKHKLTPDHNTKAYYEYQKTTKGE